MGLVTAEDVPLGFLKVLASGIDLWLDVLESAGKSWVGCLQVASHFEEFCFFINTLFNHFAQFTYVLGLLLFLLLLLSLVSGELRALSIPLGRQLFLFARVLIIKDQGNAGRPGLSSTLMALTALNRGLQGHIIELINKRLLLL